MSGNVEIIEKIRKILKMSGKAAEFLKKGAEFPKRALNSRKGR
jgi:hypothetical protein